MICRLVATRTGPNGMMPENYRIGRVLSEVSYAVEPRAIVITMSNQYIICGASRSGKSILARRLQQKFKVSWILGDAIVSSMEDAFPMLLTIASPKIQLTLNFCCSRLAKIDFPEREAPQMMY